ncbi:MAG: hypothetical protein IKA02_06000 [Clostridia bacterium]|nr:hypothetical protein [Clostridia bacterium]
MSKDICKRKTIKITVDIIETYELILENGKYSITCTENNLLTGKIEVEEVKEITTNKKIAYKIYSLLTKHGACKGTIKDIVYDLMC